MQSELSDKASPIKLWLYNSTMKMSNFSPMMRGEIIAEQLGVAASTLDFSLGEHGKPYLSSHPNINFSISHSGTFWAMALHHHSTPLGLDIERHQPRKYMAAIMDEYFHPDEYAYAKNIENKEERMEFFYRLWTQKEAYAKYLGEGLNYSFSSMSFIQNTPKHIEIITTTSHADNALPLSIALIYENHNESGFISCSSEQSLVWDTAGKSL